MGETKTDQEVLNENIAKMGKELGQLYHDLSNDLTWLHFKWRDYRELYGVDQARIDILNRTAPHCFARLEDILFQDILLHISRITDQARYTQRSSVRENLTVNRLAESIQDPSLQATYKKLLKTAMKRCKFVEGWRNRVIAHTDLQTAQQPGAKPLPHASRQKVEEALESLRDLLNCIELHYNDATVGYEASWSLAGAESLVYYLQMGIRAQEEEDKRWA